jgi:hypothetical protein
MERCIAPGGCRVVRLESYFLPRAALGLEAAGGLFAPIPLRRSGRETPDFGPKTFFVCSKSGICRGGSLPGVHTVFGGRVGRGDQSSVTRGPRLFWSIYLRGARAGAAPRMPAGVVELCAVDFIARGLSTWG